VRQTANVRPRDIRATMSTRRSTLWSVAKFAALSVLVLATVLTLVETFAFLGRSEGSAREKALVEFQRLCESRCGSVGLTSGDFTGPELSATTSRTYSFLWRARRGDAQIVVAVSYAPQWTESWLIRP
jgi:hypothetical protein